MIFSTAEALNMLLTLSYFVFPLTTPTASKRGRRRLVEGDLGLGLHNNILRHYIANPTALKRGRR